jgi:hypothetical protein
MVLADIYKRELHLAENLYVHLARDANASRFRDYFETSSDIDAIAIDTGIVEDDVALIDADAKAHAAPFFNAGIALRHRPLDCHGALGCVHDAAELREDPIAGGVNDAAAVLCNHGEYDGLMRLEVANRAGFIGTHEGAVASDVRRKNRC